MRQANLSQNSYIALVVIVLVTALGVVDAFEGTSNDSSLKFLSNSISSLQPKFDPAVLSYTSTVDNAIDSVDIRANANNTEAIVIIQDVFLPVDPWSHVSFLQNFPLEVGANEVTIKVIAEDNSSTDYTLTITREAP